MWPEIAKLPNVEPERIIAIPTQQQTPRFTTGGPVLLGDLALVSSSQFGFVAVDFRRGVTAWTKPGGSHVAPPVIVDGNAVLIGTCVNPPEVPADTTLLGCMRVVSAAGADQAYIAIRGKGVADFNESNGEQLVWSEKPGAVTWRRGEESISIDLLTGVATALPVYADDPPLVAVYKTKRWRVTRDLEGRIKAQGTPSWQTEDHYGPLLGIVYIPEMAPLVRTAKLFRRGGAPEILIFDMDATGSLHGQVSLSPIPGLAITGHAADSVGDVALAVRLDTSLQRDYIAGFAANGLLMWTYPLPQIPRPDPIGVAMAPDAVVVFHDGDTLTVLPEVSAPPTAPGAVRAPLENPTP